MYSFYGIWREFHNPLKEETAPYKFRMFVYYIPVSIGAISFFLNYTATTGTLKLIIPALSFFVGLLTNSVVFLLRYSDTNDPRGNLIDQTRNISIYLIVLGIFILGFTMSGYLSSVEYGYQPILARVYSAVVLFLLTHFFFSVLLLPARIFVIIENTTNI